MARIAFQGLVGHFVAERLAHRTADDVFRGDELDLRLLARRLILQGSGDQRIAVRQAGLGTGWPWPGLLLARCASGRWSGSKNHGALVFANQICYSLGVENLWVRL